MLTVEVEPPHSSVVVKEDVLNTRRTRRPLIAVGLALATVLPLAACAGGGSTPGSTEGGGSTGTDPSSFSVLTAN